jgi:hypothetical protein
MSTHECHPFNLAWNLDEDIPAEVMACPQCLDALMQHKSVQSALQQLNAPALNLWPQIQTALTADADSQLPVTWERFTQLSAWVDGEERDETVDSDLANNRNSSNALAGLVHISELLQAHFQRAEAAASHFDITQSVMAQLCPNPETLSAYYDSELSGKDRFAVEKHLEACAPCQQKIWWLRRTSEALSNTPNPAMPDLWPAMRFALPRQPRRWPVWVATIAASMVLLVMGSNPFVQSPLARKAVAHFQAFSAPEPEAVLLVQFQPDNTAPTPEAYLFGETP